MLALEAKKLGPEMLYELHKVNTGSKLHAALNVKSQNYYMSPNGWVLK